MAATVERNDSTIAFMPRRIVFAFDALKTCNMQECNYIINNVRMQDDIIKEANSIQLLGVLDKVLHPMGFQIKIGPESFIGAHARAIEEEVSRKVEAYVGMLKQSAEDCEGQGIDIEVKIVVGAPLKKIIVQEIVALDASWAIIDRYHFVSRKLRKDLKFYLQHIPCKVAQVVNNLSLEVLRPYYLDMSTSIFECKMLYSISKPVPLPPSPDDEIDKHCDISMSGILSPKSSHILESGLISASTTCTKEEKVLLQDESNSIPPQEPSGCLGKLETEFDEACQVMQRGTSEQNDAEVPTASEIIISDGCSDSQIQITSDVPSVVSDVKNECEDSPPVIQTDNMRIKNLSSMGFTYSTIQTATDYFSSDNVLGEGRHAIVYKGQLKDGQLITVKVQKDANAQGCEEFLSQVFVLSTVRHSNIEKFFGFSCKENLNILVYEFIGNKSLEWHLFDNTAHVLEWHHRQTIAIGATKGLRFLHQEWWGSPLIHQHIRPNNIFLTEDFVPLLGNCNLSKWKMNKRDLQRSTENLEYLAPEHAENGIVSIKMDIYALGIVLIQLISGQKAADLNSQQSLRQWALPLIQTLALDELVDPRLGNSYCTYELYSMARAAYMCIQTNPEIRPTAEEVLHLLEGTNDHRRHLKSNLYPIILSTESSLN